MWLIPSWAAGDPPATGSGRFQMELLTVSSGFYHGGQPTHASSLLAHTTIFPTGGILFTVSSTMVTAGLFGRPRSGLIRVAGAPIPAHSPGLRLYYTSHWGQFMLLIPSRAAGDQQATGSGISPTGATQLLHALVAIVSEPSFRFPAAIGRRPPSLHAFGVFSLN